MTPYVALYCRISKDKKGQMEGVDTQEKWGRRYAAQTWPGLPIKVFKDNNLSAATEGPRPGYIELRAAVARGEVAHVWVVEQSRLERREVGWFELRDEFEAAGIPEIHTNRDGIVQVRNIAASIKAVFNADEVRVSTQRTRERVAEEAADGRPGGVKPFGYAHDVDKRRKKTYVMIPEQAEAIRFAADKILSGWSLSNIAAELRRRGLHGAHRRKVRDAAGEPVKGDDGAPVTRPTTITAGTVRSMVTNHAVAGYRVHNGRTIKGVWEPILDEATWQAVRAKLGAPREVTRIDGGTYKLTAARRPASRRRYLLTGGLAVCGVCEAPLTASMKQLKNGKGSKPYYLCHPKYGGRGCVGIMAEEFEQYVAEKLIDRLNSPEFMDALTAGDDHAARRDVLVTSLGKVDDDRSELAGMWGAGEVSAAEWRAARQTLEQRERALRAELATVPPPVTVIDPAVIAEAWNDPDTTLDERREVMAMCGIVRVTVNRAKPGTKGFDPGRVRIKWTR